MGEVLHMRAALTLDEAWKRYIDLVDERATNDLWKDSTHNKRLSDAWQAWSDLYQRQKEPAR